jgi:hypothetical protein
MHNELVLLAFKKLNLIYMRRILLFTSFVLIAMTGALAQGVTTSSISGKATDQNGEALPGATVVALHTSSGSQYGITTDATGFFRIPNMRVGGPYTITVSFIGYNNFQLNNVYLSLGQNFKVDARLSESATQLEEITVTDVNDSNNGLKTVVDEREINAAPTIARAIADFARFNPLANIQQNTDGFSISLAGQNNRYNAIYIDGAINNDVFGLAGSGTNGGQTGVQPISIDAIEQFQISVSPFDVRQGGFSGGAINAVTRSGSNNIEGSAYYLFRNENLAGKTPIDKEDDQTITTDDPKKLNDFSAKTYGFRVGGPIIKDKLFFFVNVELQRDETPQPFDFTNYTGNDNADSIAVLRNKLASYGYDPGVFDANTEFLNSDKFLIKLDWNLNENHKVTIRHSYTSAENLEARSSSSTFLGFINGSEYFLSKTNSSTIEIKSVFGNKFSNKFVLGATFVRDDRDVFGDPFPTVLIRDANSTSYQFGAEPFSTANLLNQDVITLTNDFEIYKGKHTITIGTHNEYYNVGNLFIRQNFGSYQYDNLTKFLMDLPSDRYDRSYSQVDNVTGDESNAIAAFKGYQLGFYGQDEFQATERLSLTFGLRFDIPIFPDAPNANIDFDTATVAAIQAEGYDLGGARPGDFINPQLLISPRVGFNWDVKGDRDLQLRGGVGIFTSRIPLVWPGGAFNNYGFNIGGISNSDTQVFDPDVNNQAPGTVDVNNPSPSGQIDLFAKDFKLPQVLKLNIAVDKQLPFGLVASFEAIYTKTINNIFYENLNLKKSTESFDGTPDDRPYFNYSTSNRVDPTYTGIYLATNTSKGSSYNIVASLSKKFDFGLTTNLAYTYGDSRSLNDGLSSQNNSQWQGYQNVQGRNFQGDAQRSVFSIGNRIIAQLSYRKEYLGFAATQISLFYNGQSGNAFSYVVGASNSSFINDGGFNNSELIYIPKDQSDIIFVDTDVDGVTYTAQEQWDILNKFIGDDKYLSKHRGEYAERNTARTPFESILDVRILQDVFIKTGNGKKNTLQFSLDIFNFSNLLNKDWGRRYFISNNNFSLVNFDSFTGVRTPQYELNSNIIKGDDPWENNITDSGFRSSRWQMQIGLRYIFGN